MKIPLQQIKTAGTSHFDESANNSKKQKKSDKKSINVLSLISKICFGIFVLFALVILSILIYLSVLPFKYLIILIIAIAIIAAILGFFTFKKKFGKVAKSVCIAFDIIFTIVFAIVFFYLANTMGFMDSIRANEYQTEEFQLIVLKDSVYQKTEDLNNHTVATYDENSDKYNEALKELSKKANLKAENASSVLNAVKNLLDKTTDSLLIKSSLVDVVSEINKDFTTDGIRVIDRVVYKTKIDSTESNINVSKDSYNIFISGIDTFGDISTVARSDVNMIVTVNPRTHTILLTSIPRDFYVQLHGTHGLKDKLTHAGLYGINMSISTIEDLFKLKINYYIRVNFDSTINLINAIGGIYLTPDFTFSRTINGQYCYYEEGKRELFDGLCALRYARERKAYGAGDLHRIQNQQVVLTEIIDKLTSSKVLLAKYTDILSSMSGAMETNIPSSNIYKLINEQLDSMPSWKIERISTTGNHIDAPTYTFPDQNLYVFVPDEASVNAATAKIQEVMSAN